MSKFFWICVSDVALSPVMSMLWQFAPSGTGLALLAAAQKR